MPRSPGQIGFADSALVRGGSALRRHPDSFSKTIPNNEPRLNNRREEHSPTQQSSDRSRREVSVSPHLQNAVGTPSVCPDGTKCMRADRLHRRIADALWHRFPALLSPRQTSAGSLGICPDRGAHLSSLDLAVRIVRRPRQRRTSAAHGTFPFPLRTWSVPTFAWSKSSK